MSLGAWIRWEPVAYARHYAAEIGGSPFTRFEKCYRPLGIGNAVKKKLKEVYEGFTIGTPLEQARYGDQLTMCRVSGKWYLFLRKSKMGSRKLLQYPVLMERRVESGARDQQTSVKVEPLSPGLPTVVLEPRTPLSMIADDKRPPPRQVGHRGSILARSSTVEERRKAPLTNNARIPSSRVYVNSILIKGLELVNLRVSSGEYHLISLNSSTFSWGGPPAYDVLALPEMLLVPKGQPDDGCFVFAELTNATDRAQVSASLNEAGLAFGIKNFDLESITFCEMRKRRAVAQLRLGRQYMTLSNPDLVIPLKDAPPAQSFDEIYREYELDEAGSLNQGVKRSRGRDDEVGRTGSRKKMKSS
ncbi:hypothetical protein FOZ60_014919 [Perkinsus olseni]|uniref:Uncharacterized protein n=1 Tax=Perkinsus olseni TaxID=32597 RepID=A0A7J6P7R6_PEROL|nr:hypothetical protein FOZ60_014919 [Perkinsus olseni]